LKLNVLFVYLWPGVERGCGLKQEKVSGEEWSSCGGVAGETTFHDLEEAEATSPRRISEVGRGLTKHMEAEATSPRRISEVGRGLNTCVTECSFRTILYRTD
jgi:hypothetical protein